MGSASAARGVCRTPVVHGAAAHHLLVAGVEYGWSRVTSKTLQQADGTFEPEADLADIQNSFAVGPDGGSPIPIGEFLDKVAPNLSTNMEELISSHGITIAGWVGSLSILPITLYAFLGGSVALAGGEIVTDFALAMRGAFGANSLWRGGRNAIDGVIEDDALKVTFGVYEAASGFGAFSDSGEGLGASSTSVRARGS